MPLILIMLPAASQFITMAALSHTGDFTYGWIQNLFVYHNYMVGLGCVFSPPYCLLLLHLAIYFDARGFGVRTCDPAGGQLFSDRGEQHQMSAE